MPEVHKYVGFAIVAGWAVVFLWGGVAFIAKREPGPMFWRILGVLQGILLLQVVLGLILWTTHRIPGVLHPLYGAIFPLVVLTIAHVLARGMDDERDRWKVFAVASFFVFGLTLRALMTGLGAG
jgi:hypothetical protein